MKKLIYLLLFATLLGCSDTTDVNCPVDVRYSGIQQELIDNVYITTLEYTVYTEAEGKYTGDVIFYYEVNGESGKQVKYVDNIFALHPQKVKFTFDIPAYSSYSTDVKFVCK